MVYRIDTAQGFNDRYPVGTPVIVKGSNRKTRTRGPAFEVAGTAVVPLSGVRGAVPLDQVMLDPRAV